MTDDLLVLTGTHQGLVKCHQLSWGDDVHSLKIDSLGHVSDADGMSVSAVEMLSINTRCEVIICAKNNFVLFYSVRIDPSSDTATGNVQVLDQRHTSFQGLNISSKRSLNRYWLEYSALIFLINIFCVRSVFA